MSHISEFIDAMKAAGVGPNDTSSIKDTDEKLRYMVAGDKPKTQNGAYSLATDGDFSYGWFMSFKEGVVHKWHSKSNRKWSDDEKTAHKASVALRKKQRVEQEKRDHEAAAARALGIWNGASKTGQSDYLDRKKIDLHGVRVSKGSLVVPLRIGADVVGLQFIKPDGEKRFLAGSKIDGAYFSIAKAGDDMGLIYIVEGFATGASVRQATGAVVIVAFNAGNLKAVARTIARKYADARVVIAADNDHETTNQKGEPWNVGMEKASAAAVAIGGAHVVAPVTEASVVDWNDVHVAHGLDAVNGGLTVARVAPPEIDEVGPEDDSPLIEPVIDPLNVVRPLGHDMRKYYFFPRGGGQVVSMTAQQLGSMQALYELAPRDFWELHYGGDGAKDSDITKYASAHLIAECQRRGIFSLGKIRGVGAWNEGNGVVVNCGSSIIGDGIDMPPSAFDGDNVYESGTNVIDLDVEPLLNSEAIWLRKISHMLKWKRPQFADLLAGWLVIAPFGPVFDWRPHIVLTGRSGSGKSTVMENIIKHVLGDVSINLDGGTTEAGLRGTVSVSGRPVVMDEAESESARARAEMEKILELMRKSSSGGTFANANATFTARSCYCLGAINPRITETADLARNTLLILEKNNSATRRKEFGNLMDAIREHLPDGFSERLFRRTYENIDTLLHNIKVFNAEASRIFGDQRAADQIAPMLAGAYSLTTTKRITKADAAKWMDAQDWEWQKETQDMNDSERLVLAITSARVRYDHLGMGRESSIGELIYLAATVGSDGHDAAVMGLKGYGIRIIDGQVCISNSSPNLRNILKETPWIPWSRTLGDYAGAGNNDNKPVYFQTGHTVKVTTIPLASILEQKETGEVEVPFDDMGGF